MRRTSFLHALTMAVGLLWGTNALADTDMTSRLTNPGFDNGTMTKHAPAGWTALLGPVPTSKISITAKADGLIADSQNHWQLYITSSGFEGKVYQRVSGLPSGHYRVGVTFFTEYTEGSINLYANQQQTPIGFSQQGQYAVETVVTDGKLELGLNFHTTAKTLVDFDSFTLTLLDTPLSTYVSRMGELKAEAAAAVTTLTSGQEGLPGYSNTSDLQAAIAQAETADTGSESSLIASINQLQTVIADYESICASYDSLAVQIQTAKDNLTAYEYPARTAYEQAIAKAEAVYNADTDQRSNISAARKELMQAFTAYYESQFTAEPQQQTVSRVDVSLDGSERFVLRIDETPFFYASVQMRPDKLRGYRGWSEDAIENAVRQAAEDGFNLVSMPIHWREVEPEKDVFDWRIIDRYLGWCKKYGLKFEMLWFSWSGCARVVYLHDFEGLHVVRTPDYVCSLFGTSDYNMLHGEWEYALDWRDYVLRERETFVLSKVMEHIAQWDANNGNPHTLVGVQVGNEARSHYENTATGEEIIEWYDYVAKAVKESKYVVWTRHNCVNSETTSRLNANEKRRGKGGNIDFIGIDQYGTQSDRVRGNFNGWFYETGRNYQMIMEIDGHSENTPMHQFAALSGNKAISYYNFCTVEGNYIYSADGTTLIAPSYIDRIRSRNKVLNYANQDIALKAHGQSMYVYNWSGNVTDEDFGLEGISFTPAEASTQAIAVRHSDTSILLMPTAAGTFRLPKNLKVKRASMGYMDAENNWVETGTFDASGELLTMDGVTCVQLEVDADDGAVDVTNLLTNPEFDDATMNGNAPAGWTLSEKPHTSKISTAEKGDGRVIHSGENHWQIWDNQAFTATARQQLTGLPNGIYVLRMGIYALFSGTVSLVANDNTTPVIHGTSCYYEVRTQVTDGTLTIGLDIATTGSVTDLEIDHFTLTRIDVDENVNNKKVKVFTIGDSTMSDKTSATERGWGMLFPTFVDEENVTVSNYAADGRSTLSFINEGRWQTVADQLSEDDFVLIQFGHNDEKTDASLHTDPQTTYKENLTKFITESRAKGAKPVLLTPIVRRIFGSDGNIYDEHTDYAEAMRELSTELSVPLIDMNLMSRQYENIAGIEGSRALHEYFPGTEIDNTHLCQLGAYITARCVAEQIAADESIDIQLNDSPAALDGAYSSTLDFAQHAFAATYPDEEMPVTMADLDAAVRRLRLEARQSVASTGDATFTIVNPSFDEGLCWYNAVQATRPMGWTLDISVHTSKISTAAKGGGVIAGSQNHWQIWNNKATTGKAYQTISNLPNGIYTLGVTLVCDFPGNVKLYGNNNSKAIISGSYGQYTVDVAVTDGSLTMGLDIATTAGITDLEMDDFTFTYKQALGTYNGEVCLNESDTEVQAAISDVNVTLIHSLSASYWNTFSVPFSASIPDGWSVKQFASAADNIMTFEDATSIEAGKPYLVKPTADVENPTFENVSITATEGITEGTGDYTFAALLTQQTLDGTTGTIAYLATDGSVKKLNTSTSLKGQRAYFNIPAISGEVKLNLGETITDINDCVKADDDEVVNSKSSNGKCYDLSGCRVIATTLSKGIYIINGKQTIIK